MEVVDDCLAPKPRYSSLANRIASDRTKAGREVIACCRPYLSIRSEQYPGCNYCFASGAPCSFRIVSRIASAAPGPPISMMPPSVVFSFSSFRLFNDESRFGLDIFRAALALV